LVLEVHIAGSWSPVVGYVVFYEVVGRVSPSELPSSYEALVREDLPHRVVPGSHTVTTLDGLDANSDYVVLILSRNKHGWGTQWSAPVVVSTKAGIEAPRAAEAPAVHPHDTTCHSVDVKLPSWRGGCRSADEYLVQVYSDSSQGWVTTNHAKKTGVAGVMRVVEGINPERAFLVRIVARNAAGDAAPGGTTAVKPGPWGGCVSERDWQPDIPPLPAVSSGVGAAPHQLRNASAGARPSDMNFQHQGASKSFGTTVMLALVLLSVALLSCAAAGAYLVLRTPAYAKVARDDEDQQLLADPVTEIRAKLRGYWEDASQDSGSRGTIASVLAALPWGGWIEGTQRASHGSSGTTLTWPSPETPSRRGDVGADTLQYTHSSLGAEQERSLEMLDDTDEAALLARVASLLGQPGTPPPQPDSPPPPEHASDVPIPSADPAGDVRHAM
jgi:hypothetical protein